MLTQRWRSEGLGDAREMSQWAATSAEEHKSERLNNGAGYEKQPFEDAGVGSYQESDVKKPKHFQLQTLLSGAAPEVLEAAVERGVEVLENLKNPLVEKAPHAPDAAQWLQQIGKWLWARGAL